MEGFAGAWDALHDSEQSLLLEHRHTGLVAADVAAVLARVHLIAFRPWPGGPSAHWPVGLREFLDDTAAAVGDDPDCE